MLFRWVQRAGDRCVTLAVISLAGLELTLSLPEGAGQLRNLGAPEEQQNDCTDDEKFGTADEGEQSCVRSHTRSVRLGAGLHRTALAPCGLRVEGCGFERGTEGRLDGGPGTRIVHEDIKAPCAEVIESGELTGRQYRGTVGHGSYRQLQTHPTRDRRQSRKQSHGVPPSIGDHPLHTRSNLIHLGCPPQQFGPRDLGHHHEPPHFAMLAAVTETMGNDLECVVNVSEGRDDGVLHALAETCRRSLIDLHTDEHHNRSVFTLAGSTLLNDVRDLASAAIRLIDLGTHEGVHPRIGVVDVVPFVPLPQSTTTLRDATHARDAFAAWLAATHGVPAFIYGADRTLPDIRRNAFRGLVPDYGPDRPHVTAGACAVGARPVLIAYNLWLSENQTVDDARRIARLLRCPSLRALGLDVGGRAQVSCNLVAPEILGPAEAYDLVSEHGVVDRAELVGLLPVGVLQAIPPEHRARLDVDGQRTIEARLELQHLKPTS